MNCKCKELFELEGNDALDYIQSHLQTILVDGEKWRTLYECPLTQIQWLEDYPNSEYHGGGSPRLRKLPIQTES